MVIGWYTTNNIGSYKRAVALAAMFTIEGTATFLSAYTFVSNDAPRYIKGFSICLGAQGVGLLFTLLYTASLWWENRQRDLGRREYLRSHPNPEELGDRHVWSSINETNW